MVFMQPQDEGRPFAAVLLLFSMFAFAFVFHTVTRPEATIAAHFDGQLSALTRPVRPDVPVVGERQPAPSAAAAVSPAAIETAPLLDAAPTIEAALPNHVAPPIDASPVPLLATILPAPVAPAPPELSAVQRGAVTRSLTTSGAALRSAFKRAF
jgi:hypothetical protein